MNCHKIGETFLWSENPDKIVELKVVKDEIGECCENCYFQNHGHLSHAFLDHIEPCISRDRADSLDIHFEVVK